MAACFRRATFRTALFIKTHRWSRTPLFAPASLYSSSSTKIRIGCASGFWGDTTCAAPQLVHKGNIDYLVFDYLSEITMAILTAAKHKNSEMGYVPDFINVMDPLVDEIKKRNVKVISNAGGINPKACATALKKIIQSKGIELNVAYITGDNLIGQINEVASLNVKDIDTGKSLPKRMYNISAYLGASGIVEALKRNADIIVTGRCVDSAIVLGPLIHEFGWKWDNYNMLSCGSLAGHLVECGAQSTGGIFTDWHTVPDWDTIGFPVVECSSNGSFFLCKPPDTGGLVTEATVAEQLVYEIGDPASYQLPDVICDFSQVKLTKMNDSVYVTGAQGSAPTENYKICGVYADGYKASCLVPIGGPRAADKAYKTATSILKRVSSMFKDLGYQDFTASHIHIIGSEQSYGAHANIINSPREVTLWLAVQHQQKEALQLFSKEIAPAGTGMAPGFMSLPGGRPRVSPTLKIYSFLYPKSNVNVNLHINNEDIVINHHIPNKIMEKDSDYSFKEDEIDKVPIEKGNYSFNLGELAYTRSGDKANTVNIGVIARNSLYYPFLKEKLTREIVQDFFNHFIEFPSDGSATVFRYELPGINALNFVIKNGLGGGGTASLRVDPQGKAFGQMLLDLKISGLPNLLKMN